MNMDKPIRRVAIFALLLIFGLMAQVNYMQGSQAEDLRTDANNPRLYSDIFKTPRGQISAGGEVLVSSKEIDEEEYGRVYKDGAIFAPVTGYFRGGATGVENAYSALLSGDDSRITNQRWFDTFIGKEAEGADLELSIDPRAQRTAYEQLKRATAPGRRGGAVVMDVETGAIKVAASFPSFDPNEVANDPRSDEGAKRLEQLAKGEGVQRPLVDNAISQTFPPGSSFKVLMAALGLADGMDRNTPVDTSDLILPESNIPLPDSHEHGACGGRAPLRAAFVESCNSSFGRMAMELTIQKLHDGSEKFGFGDRVEVEPNFFAAESSVPVEVTDAEGNVIKTGQDATARSGIGQENVRSTPLQMAMVAAAVANDGVIMKPYLVEKGRAQDQSEVYSADPQEYKKAMSEDDAKELQDWMRGVVTEGTATNLQGRNIAGKTGTAEQTPFPNARWFVGFSPMEDPKYAFAVMTEGAGSGGTAAGPIAAQIMAQVLKQ
ncbi:penicillin-binding transpeptidase domain-containing protein [Actinomadura rifamycini]|uniref:penicillin-binding transpeptidase domain-containing protein n=1 Tax=Actinomadura rifamycini TaxID=31962 RepID=UPI0003F50F90|nr:penicillin-binding transpeptidase domain-containing protein [Actinomadura rifamycini]